MLTPVILCGGSGTRLWPLSRNCYPKQLLPLVSSNSLLQDTFLRLSESKEFNAPLVICHEEYRFLVAEQLQNVGIQSPQIILEPIGRNTAPATAIAAIHTQQNDQDPILLVLPADHAIKNNNKFLSAISKAVKLAEQGFLVTFGVIADKPETGYGYIKKGMPTPTEDGYLVEKFVEKPDLSVAEDYVRSGEYLWNSGIFIFRASVYLSELKKHAPEIAVSCAETYTGIQKSFDFIRLQEKLFANSPSVSIDYAVMEKTTKAAVIPLDAGWSDVGSWKSLWETHDTDSNGNVLHGDVLIENVENSYLRAESRMLAAVGVSDLIVVETADAVLVANKEHSQAVREIVAKLNLMQRVEAQLHRKVNRPWGCYETIDQSNQFLAKRITVRAGASLSLQMHHKRAEHWIVVKGIAKVTRGEDVFTLHQNESTYIPVGVKHRLQNEELTDLEIIEVQTGDYFGEDDIVRFEDIYGREGQK